MLKLNNTLFSNVRGFGYQPSYGSTGMEIWDNFDHHKIELEVALGKKYFPEINTLRLWLSFDAFIKNPKLFQRNFDSLIRILEKHDLQAMPVLFNNWHSIPDFGGVAAEMINYWNHESRCCVFTDYLNAIVGPHAHDKRILAWDLCNEPFNSGGREEVFVPWLKRLSNHCRNLEAQAPVTIGTSPGTLETVDPFCDVLTPHCYFAKGVWSSDEASFYKALDDAVSFANRVGKPMFAGETGWGTLDDMQRSTLLQVELGALTERNLGFCIHMLNHSLVGDGHRPEYGIVSEAGFMGCIEADGSLRHQHEIINKY